MPEKLNYNEGQYYGPSFFHGSKPNSFNHEHTNDSTKKEDHNYGSSLLCATDQQTKQGQVLRLRI